MRKIPTVQQVGEYLESRNPLGLRGARVKLISAHNHLIYTLDKESQRYALRMINLSSHRQHEWISLWEEYEILGAVGRIRRSPTRLYYDDNFFQPLLIQEWIKGTCFNDLKPLSPAQLREAARAIAEVNVQDVSPAHFDFMDKYVVRGFQRRLLIWMERLGYALWRTRRRDMFGWVRRIFPLILQAEKHLRYYSQFFVGEVFSFHFDGAHTGNTFWVNDSRVMFIDWQRVSWRDDPTFMLVRFATSTAPAGDVSEEIFRTLLDAYLDVRPIVGFGPMARARLLERQVSDLVWVLWEYARKGETGPVKESTNVARRYAGVQKLLETFK